MGGMTPRHFLLAALLIATIAAAPAAAQSRSEAILLGELRQNQEQLTRLSAIVSQLAEQMKALDKRLIDQETATSKGFADQRVTITGLQTTMQTMREKLPVAGDAGVVVCEEEQRGEDCCERDDD